MKGSSMRLNKVITQIVMLFADYPGTFFTLQIEETSAGNTQRVSLK
ncbi:hypothetical protein MJK71_16190 [Escherichia coli]|nr:hypothetical protein MJK71_16190 [Escherichia coli]